MTTETPELPTGKTCYDCNGFEYTSPHFTPDQMYEFRRQGVAKAQTGALETLAVIAKYLGVDEHTEKAVSHIFLAAIERRVAEALAGREAAVRMVPSMFGFPPAPAEPASRVEQYAERLGCSVAEVGEYHRWLRDKGRDFNSDFAAVAPAPAQGEREAGPLVEFVTQVSLGAYGSGELLRDARAALAAQPTPPGAKENDKNIPGFIPVARPAAPADVLKEAMRLADKFGDACYAVGDDAAASTAADTAATDLRAYLAQHLSAQPAAAPEPVAQKPAAWIWKYANGEEEVVFVDASKLQFDPETDDVPSEIVPLYTCTAAPSTKEAGHD